MNEQDRIEARIAKVDEELGLVFGWAIVCKIGGEDYFDLNIDRHTGERVPEHIPETAMVKAALDFMLHSRAGNVMHTEKSSGDYPFAFPLTTDIAKAMGITTIKTGLMIAYRPEPEVLAKYKDGTFTGFSIEGRKIKSTEVETNG